MPGYSRTNPLPTMTVNQMLSTVGSQGDLVYIPDLGMGGSVWYSNGTVWNAVNHEYGIHSLAAPASHSGAAGEELIAQVFFPANSLQTGDVIETDIFVSKTGTVETVNYRHRFGPLGTTSDQAAATSIAQPTATVRNTRGYHQWKVESPTSLNSVVLNSAVTFGVGTTISTPITIDTTIDNYMSLCLVLSTGGIDIATLGKWSVKHKTMR